MYAFARDPATLPLWAAGLVDSDVRQDGEDLVIDTPAGRTVIRFVARNEFGVLDHEVTTPDGLRTLNPFRVLPHPQGSEAVFTVRQLALSDAEFERDAALVEADLDRLRELLERG